MPVQEEIVEEVVKQVAGYEFTAVRAEDTEESRRRWEERSEALAAWLLSRWREQHREEAQN